MQDESEVKARGPQKSILAERSFPPAKTYQLLETTHFPPLITSLLLRIRADGRTPAKLAVSWRQGYASSSATGGGSPSLVGPSTLNPKTLTSRGGGGAAGVKTKSGPVPAELLRWIKACTSPSSIPQPTPQLREQNSLVANNEISALQSVRAAGAEGEGDLELPQRVIEACVKAGLELLKSGLAGQPPEVTRLAVSVGYTYTDIKEVVGSGGGINSYFSTASGNSFPKTSVVEKSANGTNTTRDIPSQGQGQMIPNSKPTLVASKDTAPKAAEPVVARKEKAPVASYRNAEALALQSMFASTTAQPPAAAAAHGVDGADLIMSAEERASLKLAMKLQREEVDAISGAGAGASRGNGGFTNRHQGGRAKQAKRGAGPLDAFLKKKNRK